MLPGCFSRPRTPSKTLDAAIVLLATQAPLPSFLRNAYPEPGSRIAQTAYATGSVDIEDRWYYRLTGATCVNLKARDLLEQNDHDLSTDDHAVRSRLKVYTFDPSSRSIPVRDVVKVSIIGGDTDEKGNFSGGILTVCWNVDLVAGIYESTYEYTQTSGNILSYTWSFEITE